MKGSINLQKQYSHYRNFTVTGEISFDIPVIIDGKTTDRFKTIKVSGREISIEVDTYRIHFGKKDI